VALSLKHQVFCAEYIRCWNATDAYQAAYPKASRETARRNGSDLLTKTDISAEIQRRVDELTMGGQEVLARLAEHARADYKDFITVADNGDINLDMMKAEGKTHLIKKVTQRRTIRTTKDSQIDETVLSVELHDAQAALVQIGKHHKLFTDQVQQSGEVLVRVKYGDEGTDRPPAEAASETA
jgi:phage terminase small subunit